MNITFKYELNAKPGRDGLHTVFLRITANRKLKRIKTTVAVKPNEFDATGKNDQWVRSKNPEYKNLNRALASFLRKAKDERDELSKDGQATQAGVVDRIRNPVPDGGWTVGSFSDKLIAEAISHSVGYQRNLKSRLGVFVLFAGRDLPLRNVNLDLLNRFKRHLQASGKMSGTQHTYFNRIKRMVLEALKLELIEKDPFLHFDMPADKPAPRLKLTDTQIEAMETVEVGEMRLDAKGRRYNAGIWLFRAKWLYLFAYQMGGIRSRDVLQLRYGNIAGEAGEERLEYQMSKTGEFMSTRLNKKAREILRLFARPNVQPESYLFNILADDADYARYVTYEQKKKMPPDLAIKLYNDIASVQAQINGELKILAKKAGIADRLTFHTARHSFADKARRKMKDSKNISIDDIRQALGHTRLDTTQRYLNSFDREGLDSAMDAIFGEE